MSCGEPPFLRRLEFQIQGTFGPCLRGQGNSRLARPGVLGTVRRCDLHTGVRFCAVGQRCAMRWSKLNACGVSCWRLYLS